MIRTFSNNLVVPGNNYHVLDPFFKVRIDSIDNKDVIQENVKAFIPGDTTESPSGDWIGLSRADSNTSITFTKTFDLPKTGKYLIEIYGWKRPQVSSASAGDMTVAIDGTTIHTENMHNDWDDYGSWIRCPITDITDDGSMSLVLTVPKQAFVAYARISPITRYEGGKNYTGPTETSLELIDINFTFNGVNEVDNGEITVAFKEDFYTDDNPHSVLCFDAWDPVTIWMGEDMQSTIPMFGGYVSGWSLNDERTELTIQIVDRLMDLSRTIVWKNFSIGYIPDDTSGKFPFTQFPNVNEIARYLCSTDFGIDFTAITRDYVLYNNFAQSTGVTGLTNSGWNVEWQPMFGHPAPCMKMRPGGLNQSELTIYSDTIGVWDAKTYNYFNFDYYVSGAGIIYPVKFNIEVDMFKTGEVSSNADTYTILFSGPSVTSNVIGTILPRYDGEWNSFLIDLKSAFDNFAPAENYYISAIRFVGYPDEHQLLNNRCSSIYIDHIMGYRDFQSAPRYASSDTKTPLHELQDLCEKTNQIAYVRAGEERRDDKLIMLPKRFYTLPIDIVEGENLLAVSGLEYKPMDWGMTNTAHRSFNYDDSRSGAVWKKDLEAIQWYNYIMDHEFSSDVKTQMDAETLAQDYIDEHAFNYPAFSVVVKGSTLFEPGQYINVSIPTRRLSGTQEVKSLSYSLDCVNNYFTTEISFNQPHRSFMHLLRQTMKMQRKLESTSNSLSYKVFGNEEAGLNTSSGAYLK
jgi:hypothetical protein